MIPIVYLHDRREISGGEMSLLLLWEHLDRRRFQPILLGPESGPFTERARRLGVPVHPARYPRFRQLATRDAWASLAAAERVARELKTAILHGNAPRTNLAAVWVGRRLRRPVVWHERTLPRTREWDADRWLRVLPDRILCNSAAVARRFGGPGGRVVVIHNGVPLEQFRAGAGGATLRRELGLSPGDVAVGIVGNLSPLKDHGLFLRAAAIVAPQARRVRFFVVGGEVFPENRGRDAALRAEAGRLGLSGRVSFLGVREDMAAVMDALDIVVSAAQVEACSRAILEAMAAGTPVVGADAGGTPELVAPGESGLLFPPGDARALASALLGLIQDPALRQAMGDAARARAQAKFGIEQQVRAIEAVYEAIGEPA